MNIILLCAGFGTRMYPITEGVPKALLDINGKAVIDYLVEDILRCEGVETMYLISNNKFYGQFENWAEDWRERLAERGIAIEVFNDGVDDNENRLGAVGDLEFGLDRISKEEKTLVAAGDSIFLFEVASLLNDFMQKDKSYVAALDARNIEEAKRSGVIELDNENRIIKFVEKPNEPSSNLICPPIYFLQPESLKQIKMFRAENENLDAPGHFIAYLSRVEDVFAYKVNGGRLDIGSKEGYDLACKLLAEI